MSFFESIYLFLRCCVYMQHLSWNLLFESPFTKDTGYMKSMMILYSIFLYYHRLNLLCGPTLITFNIFFILQIDSSDNSDGLLPVLGLFFNPPTHLLSHIFLAKHRPKIYFYGCLWLHMSRYFALINNVKNK